ncbi:TPA: hypothetical protein ACHA8Z_003082, partial [Enterococcus faecium]
FPKAILSACLILKWVILFKTSYKDSKKAWLLVGVPSGKCGFTTLRKFIKETNSSALKLIIGLSLLL